MGLTNNDTMLTRAQLAVPANAYMAIGTSELTVERVSAGNYTLSFTNRVWKDQAARTDGTRPFETKTYTIPIAEADMTANVFITAYNHIKTVYTNTTDV